jgi:Fe-S cluster assembly iron-binding protein IscA
VCAIRSDIATGGADPDRQEGWMARDRTRRKEEDMLTLTDTASTVVKEIVDRSGAPAGAGLRIDTEGDSATQFAVEIAPEPQERDAIVEQAGARVYLAEHAAQALDDKTLDAHLGEDGRVAFDVLPQRI